ncbi:hypothetical protein J18TS1_09660 [Oceanobacillus oncorhynchi subsp. incaldanensis]|uniref:Phospholipid phosphatase n=1 Tax=Oceanobacillus oncorhynchi TaxID=545501 RepID=A0A0A1MNJ3_9BACI|nr:hypothetical protein [Oceanobacillus oncorhynchi]UUI39138.1 hypothetical protein NP440_17675 [Oceanobacillus oncorhynchi]GIO17866.1 hypothetical protein J18TS1_09660 [Oceanobacillus oncorhynchi subsp. incaldanensis]CEI81227.1 hypothetical protein BN997_01045 [Oceanobacillus oncorhynchi]
MDTIFFAIFSISYFILLLLVIRLLKKPYVESSIYLLPVIAGLFYDNTILTIGRIIGEGDFLENLNIARYWIHAFFTPLLVLFAWKTLEQANMQWARKTSIRILAIGLTALLVFLELFTEVFNLNIEAKWEFGVLSYRSLDPSSGPPFMILVVSFVLVVVSILIWIKQKWACFFIGSLLMIIGSAIQWPIKSGAITNLFELILIISLLGTAYFQRKT